MMLARPAGTTDLTLSQAACLLRDSSPRFEEQRLTAQDVLRAAIERGVPRREGRIPALRLSDIYFALTPNP